LTLPRGAVTNETLMQIYESNYINLYTFFQVKDNTILNRNFDKYYTEILSDIASKPIESNIHLLNKNISRLNIDNHRKLKQIIDKNSKY